MKKISSFAFLFIIFISGKNYSAEAFECQTIIPTLESVVEEVTGAFSVMVFCYQNCSELLREKIVPVIEKKLLKFEAEGKEFTIFLSSLEQFIQTVKGQNNFW